MIWKGNQMNIVMIAMGIALPIGMIALTWFNNALFRWMISNKRPSIIEKIILTITQTTSILLIIILGMTISTIFINMNIFQVTEIVLMVPS